jgi:hypothetical protein
MNMPIKTSADRITKVRRRGISISNQPMGECAQKHLDHGYKKTVIEQEA